MKKLILMLAITASGCLHAQQLDLALPANHKLEVSTLEDLNSNGNFLEINDLHISGTNPQGSYKDLNYTVYVKLYYANVDADHHPLTVSANTTAVLEEVNVDFNLIITGDKQSGSGVPVTKSGELLVNGTTDLSQQVFYIDDNEYDLLNYRKVTDVRLDLTNTSEISQLDPSVRSKIVVELFVEFTRYDLTAPNLKTFYETKSANPALKNNEVVIRWADELYGATYELEWVHMPADWSNFPTKYASNSGWIVKWDNAVRVQTKKNYYLMNVVHTDGFIVSRVRSVRNQINQDGDRLIDKLVYSPWSLELADNYIERANLAQKANVLEINNMNNPNSSVNPTAISVTGFDDKNWQYIVNYANNGLKAEALSFYDGANINRQNLSISPTDEKRVLTNNLEVDGLKLVGQESYTNFAGEPVLEIMPSPLLDFSGIYYQENINTLGGSKVIRADLDDVNSPALFPQTLDDGLNDEGAAQYYSAFNKNLDLNNQDENWFIPKAYGYPYSLNVYLNDGSGRLKSSIAPGQEFANSEERNNRYFYSQPTQTELNYMFGTNVGDKAFYKKNITIDGNGVTSIAYIDQKDRTIATSLIGQAKDIIGEPLSDDNIKLFEEDLLANNSVVYNNEDKSFKTEHSIFVAEGGLYQFDYELMKNSFVSCGDLETGNPVCYECDYDFFFYILNEDGEMILDVSADLVNTTATTCEQKEFAFSTINHVDPNFTYNESIDGQTREVSIELQAQTNYTILQELRLKTEKIDLDAISNLADANCPLNDLEHFIREELDQSNFELCSNNYKDPCSFVRDSLMKDFRLPLGAFVKGASDNDDIVDYIISRTRREVNCDGSPTYPVATTSVESLQDEVNYRKYVKKLFKNQFGHVDPNLTFRDFKEEHLLFFLEYHPSKCKLGACELLNSSESLKFDELLESSTSISDFEAKLNGANLYADFPAKYGGSTGHLEGKNFLNNTSNYNLSFNATTNTVSSNARFNLPNNSWATAYSSDINELQSSPVFEVSLLNSLALLAFDPMRIYAEGGNSEKVGFLEPSYFPNSKECYFVDVNGGWPGNYWGLGSFTVELDLYYIMLGYFSSYQGCPGTSNMEGINELSFDAIDPSSSQTYLSANGTQITAAEKWWEMYKSLYASAKRNFVTDVINYSACKVKDHTDFFYTDPNAGTLPTNLVNNWLWGKHYDWGEWWTNASDCNIYLGKAPEDRPYSDITDPAAFLQQETDPNKIKELIKEDLLDLMQSTWSTTCYNDFKAYANNSNNNIDYIALLNANSFDYLQGILTIAQISGCSPYDLNLSSIFTPYYQGFKIVDSQGNQSPYFSRSFPTTIQVNCNDFQAAKSIATSSPHNLQTPIINGYSDLDITESNQVRMKNYLNYELGLNLAMADYYELAINCVASSGANSAFGTTDNWVGTTTEIEIKNALASLNSNTALYLADLSNTALFSTINNATVPNPLNATEDYLGFGEVGYGNHHQDLYFLDNKVIKFQDLLANFNTVFNALKTELSSTINGSQPKYPDIEDTYYAHAKTIENVGGSTLSLVVNGVPEPVKIERAIQYSGGTILVRLVDANNVYFDDYYFHYRPNTESSIGNYYRLSDLTSSTSDVFNDIKPVFTDVEVRYVRLDAGGADLIASTSKVLETATRLSKVQLDNIFGTDALPFKESCEDLLYESAKINGQLNYDEYIESLKGDFKQQMIAHCTNEENLNGFSQELKMTYSNNEHHFMLYFYDQADNLVATVPPEGFISYDDMKVGVSSPDFKRIEPGVNGAVTNLATYSSAIEQEIHAYRNKFSNNQVVPIYKLQTTYKYNSDNQIIKQQTPNGGISLFWYDQQGRLALSQNAEQRKSNKFSYTLYDAQSRIEETGETQLQVSYISPNNATEDGLWTDLNYIFIYGQLNLYPANNPNYDIIQTIRDNGLRNDVVRTTYDHNLLPEGSLIDFEQENLRSRVSTQAYYPIYDNTTTETAWHYATHYSYDPVGNVKTVVNDYLQKDRLTAEANRFKRTDYEYDPINGNVLKIYYQLGEEDAFYHRYAYDAENKIKEVETSRDGVIWDTDASYQYYEHGPLARTELGEQKVQGIDYAYTLQGWLKMVNNGVAGHDMGKDEEDDNPYGEDAFGFGLQFFNGDYEPIAGASAANYQLDHPSSQMKNLYNGNIAAKSMHNQEESIGKIYTYDQLNRLRGMEEHDMAGLFWASMKVNGFSSAYEYDQNGNIKKLNRVYHTPDDAQPRSMLDNMTYNYLGGTDRLDHVSDIETASSVQNFTGQTSGNYEYDDIGNLTKDRKNKIHQIEWYPNGKIKRVKKNTATAGNPNLYFEYDPMGNRVKKEVSFLEKGKFYIKTIYYVRDAQGNIMATYNEKDSHYITESEVDGEFHYQFSNDYAYYSKKAGELLPNYETDLISYLNSSAFSKKVELLNSAQANLVNFDNIRTSIMPHLEVNSYLNEYSDASERILAQEMDYFSNYLHVNYFSDFLTIVNGKNEAYIEALKLNNDQLNFYNSFTGLYLSELTASQQIEHTGTIFNMNKVVANDAYLYNRDLFKELLRLDHTQYTEVYSAYHDNSWGVSKLRAHLSKLETELGNGNRTVNAIVESINGILMVTNLSSNDIGTLLNGINTTTFTTAQNWLADPDLIDQLHSALYHLDYYYELHGLSAPYAIASLSPYNPMAAMDWAKDLNGDYLSHFLHTDYIHADIHAAAEAYFIGYTMTPASIYFTNSEAKDYVVYRVLDNSQLPVIRTVLEHTDNIDMSKNALYQTEDITHLINYVGIYFPAEVLELNYNDDYLQYALSNVLNYSTVEYATDLKQHFDPLLNIFNTPLDGSTEYAELKVQSFDLYGSARLGVMDATISRKDESIATKFSRKLKAKTYELSDHLGNVVATVSDKKLHPQETIINGTQTLDPDMGFQADVISRYDRFPFGMEILERSENYSVHDEAQNIAKVEYRGLLEDCSQVLQVGPNSVGATANCVESTEPVYGETYVSYLGLTTTNQENEAFFIILKKKLSDYIVNIDPNAVYRFEVAVSQASGRNVQARFTAPYGNGVKIIPAISLSAGSNASATEIRAADDKLMQIEFTGEQLQSIPDMAIFLNFTKGWASGPSFLEVIIDEIRVYKLIENTSVPTAQYTKANYPYGFQGQEVDNEWNGVAFGGGKQFVWSDPIDRNNVFTENFTNLDYWNTTSCVSLVPSGAELNANGSNCEMTSYTLYVEEGKEYSLVINADRQNGGGELRWEYYDETSSNWQTWYTEVMSGGGAIYTKVLLAPSDLIRLRVTTTVPSLSRIIMKNVSVTEELGDWWVDNINTTPNFPVATNENGRVKLVTNEDYKGLHTIVDVTDLGQLHTLYFDAEIVEDGNNTLFVTLDESPDGQNYWQNVGIKVFNEESANQTYSIDFTPTKTHVRIYIALSTQFSTTTAYFDNFKLSNGAIEPSTGGGTNGKVAFKYRIHDPEIGRFLSRDPLAPEYPFYSPYAFSGNRVIDMIELEGLEPTRHPNDFNGEYLQDWNFAAGLMGASDETDWIFGSGDQQKKLFYCTTCMGSSGKPGHLMWQKRTWVSSIQTQTTSNVVNGRPNIRLQNQGNLITLTNGFVRGTSTPTGALTAAVNAAQAVLDVHIPQQVQVGPIVPTTTTTTGPVYSNNDQTRTTTTVNTTQQQQQITTSQNVVLISFSTTLSDNDFARRVLQERFNGLLESLGNNANIIYNPDGNNYRQTTASMGGTNQVIINAGLRTTTTNQVTNTTKTTIETENRTF